MGKLLLRASSDHSRVLVIADTSLARKTSNISITKTSSLPTPLGRTLITFTRNTTLFAYLRSVSPLAHLRIEMNRYQSAPNVVHIASTISN